MDRTKVLRKIYYPDDTKDGTLIFYDWLRKDLKPEYTILNVGAGPSVDRKVRSLRGEVAQVVGIDNDETVLSNSDLDEAFVIHGNRFPFTDKFFDLAWADFVLEHVEQPVLILKEIRRVLKPGASFYFRTPNKNHYVSTISRMTPHWFHKLVANRACGLSQGTYEKHPTYYRFNSRKKILECAYAAGFRLVELRFIEAEPSYLAFHSLAYRIGVAYERIVNRCDVLKHCRANILGCLRK
jgi:ubiquinone/menaquinone biosynthesis C-methylase UbiE